VKVKDDDLIYDDGTVDYANNGIIGLGPEGKLYGGYDGGLRDASPAHLAELAEYMVTRWTEVWKTALEGPFCTSCGYTQHEGIYCSNSFHLNGEH
jgi:hypothetical protein